MMNNFNCSSQKLHTVQVLKVSEFTRALENAGEVGVPIALHCIEDSGRVTKSKPCCFVLDAPKEKTLQKKAGSKTVHPATDSK